eukprot:ANDGO_07403.mRNA.1 hypothetical protein
MSSNDDNAEQSSLDDESEDQRSSDEEFAPPVAKIVRKGECRASCHPTDPHHVLFSLSKSRLLYLREHPRSSCFTVLKYRGFGHFELTRLSCLYSSKPIESAADCISASGEGIDKSIEHLERWNSTALMRGTPKSISSKPITQRLRSLLKSSSFEQKPAKRWMNPQFIASVKDFYEAHLVFPEVARCLRELSPAFYRGKMKFMCDISIWMGVIEYFVIKHCAVSFYFTLVERSGTEDATKKNELTTKLEDEMRNTDGILNSLRQFRSIIIEDLELMMRSVQLVCQDRLLKFQDFPQEELMLEWWQMEEVWKLRTQVTGFLCRVRELRPSSPIQPGDVASETDVMHYLLQNGRCAFLVPYFCCDRL